MNQYFNLTRWGRLLRKHAAEQVGSYALGAAVLLGGLVLVIGFLAYVGGGPPSVSGQAALFLLFLLGAGSFFTSSVLAGYGQGSRAALALTLPASQLEKFLVAWVVSVPVFLAVFLAVFYIADSLVLSLYHQPATLFNVFERREGWLHMGLQFLLVQALALWGSIFFPRQQFVRTAFVVFGAAAGLTVLNLKALQALLHTPLAFALPYQAAKLLPNGPLLTLPATQLGWLAGVVPALVLLLWAAAYARLTEKQL